MRSRVGLGGFAPDPNAQSVSSAPARRVVVGEEVSLLGTTISTCDLMSVMGRVESNLRDCKHLGIAVGVTFCGRAAAEAADVAGVFSARLRVKQLAMRASA